MIVILAFEFKSLPVFLGFEIEALCGRKLLSPARYQSSSLLQRRYIFFSFCLLVPLHLPVMVCCCCRWQTFIPSLLVTIWIYLSQYSYTFVVFARFNVGFLIGVRFSCFDEPFFSHPWTCMYTWKGWSPDFFCSRFSYYLVFLWSIQKCRIGPSSFCSP